MTLDRPPQRRDVHQNAQAQAASRLRWLEGQIKYALQQADNSIEEIKQNELEWEAIRAQERAREAEWAKLDDDARRHWAKLPVRDYEADAYRALAKRKEEEAAAKKAEEEAEMRREDELRLQRLEEEQELEERQAEEALQRERDDATRRQQEEEEEKQRQKQAEDQARWEEEYALEEDPTFAWQPLQQESKDTEAKSNSQASQPVMDQAHEGDEHVGSEGMPTLPSQPAQEDRGWGTEFDKALLEGNNDLNVGFSTQTEIDETMFEEFLEQSAFNEDGEAPDPAISY